MARKALVITLLLVVCSLQALNVAAKGNPVEWYDFFPTWAHVSGGEEITIQGCGFRTFSEVVCVWNELWPSATSVILDDNTIICETPRYLEHEDFTTLPQWVTFKVLFDGIYGAGSATLDLGLFRFGPALFFYSPTTGVIAGGGTLTLTGEGFVDEYTSIQVYWDDIVSPGTANSDTSITAPIPSGDFNQNAIISIYFENNPHFYLHSNQTYHYGPLIEGFNPSCGHRAYGGDTVTIIGQNIADPSVTGGAAPNVSFIGFNQVPTIRSVNGAFSGGGIAVTVPLGSWQESVRIQVAYQNRDDQVAEFPAYLYGPAVFDVNPDTGFVDGGDTIPVTITGCGFSNYTNTLIAPKFDGTNCTNVNIVNDGTLTCNYPAGTCGFVEVTVDFGTVGGVFTLPIPGTDDFYYGPLITEATFGPTRGPVNGGTTLTVQGVHFTRTPTTPFATVTCDFDDGPTNVGQTTATVTSTSLSCTTPSYDFNEDVTVTFNFASGCTQQVEYHYGPLCTGINPTFGYIAGGQTVQLTGQGFTDQANYIFNVKFCLVEDDGDTLCPVDFDNDQTAPFSGTSATGVTVTTPLVVSPGNRGSPFRNRYFGDNADVYINFANYTSNPADFIYCGTYRYGPIVTDVNPPKAPMGPTYTDPSTDVTANGIQVIGAGFNDPLANQRTAVFFETVGAANEGVNSDTIITLSTLWGGESNTFHNVTVFFDICNSTTADIDNLPNGQDDTIHWGPQIFSVFPEWGIKPWGYTILTITGLGFSEFQDIAGVDQVRCIIDGFYSNETDIIDDTTIECFAPENEFGTNATVIVEFGETCLNDIPDYTRAILADTRVLYRPTIYSIDPTFGYTSGGQQVTITGEGFAGWDENPEGFGEYNCFFDHFEGTFNSLTGDTTVICTTPGNAEIDVRQYFNTDVRVHVQLNGSLTNDDWKVWYDSYHYGPICTGFAISRGLLAGGQQVTVLGSGFKDIDTFTNISIFFGSLSGAISIQDANDGGVADSALISFNDPPGDCNVDYPIRLVFDNLNTADPIECGDFTYGPFYTSQSGDYDFNSTFTYGWDGDTLTINGFDFDDPELVNNPSNTTFVNVLFGSTAKAIETTGFGTGSLQVIVPAISNQWQQIVPLTIRWQGFNETCQVPAGFFHYGPDLTAINPTNGYIEGLNDGVTLIGIAFGCCGLQNSGPDNDTVCVFDGTAFNNDTTVNDGVTSTLTGCEVPYNNVQIGRIVNVGIQFNSTGTVRRLLSPTDTQSPVTYYYGPIIVDTDPPLGPLKGGDAGPVTLTGFNLDDPFFYDAEPDCVFQPATGSSSTTPDFVDPTTTTANQVVCNSPEYDRQCGDVDYVGLRYNRTDNNQFYFLPTTTGGSSLAQVFEYAYGTVITGVTTNTGDYRSNTTGGLIVTITGNFIDWFEDRGDHIDARCTFGHFAEDDDVPIVTANTIVCTVPEGPFNWDGVVGVVFDPHWDEETELAAIPEYDAAWHWIPYTELLSRVYQPEEQSYSIVALGGGFCNYDNVICFFGADDAIQSDITDDLKVTCQTPPVGPSSVSVTLQFCDRNNPDGTDDEEQCECNYLGTPDQSTVPESFTFVGFSGSVTPTRGSIYGNTVVTLTGIGFSNYFLAQGDAQNSPVVQFIGVNTYTGIYGSSVGNDTAGTDTQIIVTTPDVSTDGDQITAIQITFTRTERSVAYGKKEVFVVPAVYDFGSPEVVSVEPADFDLDATTTITLSGNYFNGGANYFCLFSPEEDPLNTTIVGGTQPDRTVQDNQGNQIACIVPSAELGHIGVYYVQAAVSNAAADPPTQQFSDNDVTININQDDATLTGIEPDEGSEFGGTTVTITGNSLNGASQPYLCRFGDKVVGGEFRPGNKRSIEHAPRSSIFSTFDVKAVLGQGDEVICQTPTADEAETVDVAISLDGGVTWIEGVEFEYKEGGRPGDDSTGGGDDDAASALSALFALLGALLALLYVALL